jgi:hypothetical protein
MELAALRSTTSRFPLASVAITAGAIGVAVVCCAAAMPLNNERVSMAIVK